MSSPLTLRDTPDGCTLPVRVHAGARSNAITGTHDGALKISLSTPPTDGRANQALVAFLASQLNIPRSRITLLAGTTSRAKTLKIEGLTAAQVKPLLLADA